MNDLRDEFAIAAMQALLRLENGYIYRSTNGGPPKWNGFVLDQYGERRISGKAALAQMAYEAADAMLDERNKRKSVHDG